MVGELLRWYCGGKSKILDYISDFIEKSTRYHLRY